ncbi:Uncharacterized protein Rs2_35753 [Raphanus sativus]|nr:Uncharacterized protein Rs2_35753 [Raphanus sativus]
MTREHYRFTAAEKGKSVALGSVDNTKKRIAAPEFDFSDLVRENSKTLIGRVTNPKEQQVEFLVTQLPKKWALRGKVVGASLGSDCFQFRFDRDEDLQCVLLNRPYQHNNWMVILERWEPIISNTFPSKIRFWVTVRGLPLHFWHRDMADRIAHALGEMEDYEITKISARIRTLLNALEPLTIKSVVDFKTGEEVAITFEYKTLANHCSRCNMLTHSTRHCTAKVPLRTNDTQTYPYSTGDHRERSVGRLNSSQTGKQTTYSSLERPEARPYKQDGESFYQRVDRHGRPFGSRVTSEASRVQPLRNKITPNVGGRKPPKPPQLQWRVRERAESPLEQFANLHSNSPATPKTSLERNLHESEFSKQPIIPSTEEVLEDLREVTLQYVNCVDPNESAARRRRVIQGETNNLMAETASKIVAAATASASQFTSNLPGPPQVILLPNAESPKTKLASNASNGLPRGPAAGSKRRGRPPGTKKASATTKAMGVSSKA